MIGPCRVERTVIVSSGLPATLIISRRVSSGSQVFPRSTLSPSTFSR